MLLRLFIVLFVFPRGQIFTGAGRHRRCLHQPFIQKISPVPSPVPYPQKHRQPGSSSTSGSVDDGDNNSNTNASNNPFFPSYSSPPSQPVSPFPVTLPANISTISVPQSSLPRRSFSGKILAVILSLSVVSFILVVALCHAKYRRKHRDSFKEYRSDGLCLFPANAVASDDGSQSQKLPPTHAVIDAGENLNDVETAVIRNGGSSASAYQKLDSPELRPLPPLPRRNFRSRSSKRSSASEEDDDEQFYSPRVSADSADKTIPTNPSSVSDSPLSRTTQAKSPSISSSTPSISPEPPSSTGDARKLQSSHSNASQQDPPPPPPPPPLPRKLSAASDSPPPPLTAVVTNPVSAPSSSTVSNGERSDSPKPKLKPLHWDKVSASSDRTMVWDQLKSSSFQLNEEMIETLFVANSSNENSRFSRIVVPVSSSASENRVLDPKKSQNVAILLRALSITFDEVCDALVEGNADTLGTELLENLLKMAPTKEEERKLKEFSDDAESPLKLGSAEKFLKSVVDIPFAFKRIDAMLYVNNFDSEIEYLRKGFETLEASCGELKNSRMFLKLLEAVLKTGNRMNLGTNRGDARAFKLDTLVKLVDVKGADGKTTLLHFVVQEIIRSEGSRLSGAGEVSNSGSLQSDVEFRRLGLRVVAGLSGELTNVKKAAAMDCDVLSNDVSKLTRGIQKVREVVMMLNESTVSSPEKNGRTFSQAMNEFLARAEEELAKIQAHADVALRYVRELTEYFHGDSAREEAHRLRIFAVVRDFLSILDDVCKDVGKINDRTIVSLGRQFTSPLITNVSLGFPAFNRREESSDEDEGATVRNSKPIQS